MYANHGLYFEQDYLAAPIYLPHDQEKKNTLFTQIQTTYK